MLTLEPADKLVSTVNFVVAAPSSLLPDLFQTARAVCELEDARSLAHFVQTELKAFLGVEWAACLLTNTTGFLGLIDPQSLPAPALATFGATARLGRFLSSQPQPHLVEELVTAASRPENQYLAQTGTRVVVPICLGRRLQGVLLIGPHQAAAMESAPGHQWLAMLSLLISQRLQIICLSQSDNPQLVRTAKRERHHLEMLNRKQTEAREEERKHLSRELHDSVVQDLLVLQNQLNELGEQSELSACHSQRLAFTTERVGQLVQTVRQICGNLRPRWLDLNLTFSLTDLIRRYRQEHPELNIIFKIGGKEGDTDEQTRLVVYRVAQEALNNVFKHAGASQISVIMRFLPPSDMHGRLIELSVEDDGRGFTPPADFHKLLKEGHLGLLGMYERVNSLGGDLQFSSIVSRGTRLVVRVPVRKPR